MDNKWFQVFDVLIQECGIANDDYRRTVFIHNQETIDIHGNGSETRIKGALGNGGKFRRTVGDERWCVTCYVEDITAERFKIIHRTNARLEELRTANVS